MIRMEISGVMKEAPTPFCTINSVGLPQRQLPDWYIRSSSPTHHHHHQRIHHNPHAHALYGIRRFFKGSGMLDKDGDIGQLESAIEKSGIQRVSRGSFACVISDAASRIPEKPEIILGMYTISSPAMMQTDSTEATLRTRSVPKIATTKIKIPIRKVHRRYGSPSERSA